MKRYIIILSSFFALALNGLSQENLKITHGPYLCDMSETGVTIVWRTNNRAQAWVEIAPNDRSNFYSSERPKIYDSKYGRIQASNTLA